MVYVVNAYIGCLCTVVNTTFCIVGWGLGTIPGKSQGSHEHMRLLLSDNSTNSVDSFAVARVGGGKDCAEACNAALNIHIDMPYRALTTTTQTRVWWSYHK